jgi:hypothetical protein
MCSVPHWVRCSCSSAALVQADSRVPGQFQDGLGIAPAGRVRARNEGGVGVSVGDQFPQPTDSRASGLGEDDWLASRSSFNEREARLRQGYGGQPSRVIHERRLVRPARLERATSWFVAGRRESTGGSGRPLPQCFRCSVDRPKPPETASSRRGLSAVCQSCDPLVLGIRPACCGAQRRPCFRGQLSVICQSFCRRRKAPQWVFPDQRRDGVN